MQTSSRIVSLALFAVPIAATGALYYPLSLYFNVERFDSSILLPTIRSLSVGIVVTLFSGMIGVALGWWTYRSRLQGYVYPWFALPFCMGSAAWAIPFASFPETFIGFASRHTVLIFSFYALVQILQYAPLIAFVAVQSFKRTASDQADVICSMRMNSREAVRYIYWPNFRLFCYFVGAVIFCASYSDQSQATLLFRPSIGTDSQLMAHQMAQIYLNWHGRPDLALSMISSASLVATLLALVTLGCTIGVSSFLWKWALAATASKAGPIVANLHDANADAESKFWKSVSVLSIFCSVSIIAASVAFQDKLVFRALLGVGALAAFLTLTYATFAFVLRFLTRGFWEPRQERWRWLYVVALLAVRVIPGTAIFYSILTFTIEYERSGVLVRAIAWLWAHLIYNSVIIVPFLFLILLRIAQSELDFFRSLGGRMTEIVRLSMFRRFSAELLVVFVFCFTLIWNGDAANSAVSSLLQSVNTEIVEQSTNKQSNGPRVFYLVFVTGTFSVLAISLFMRLTSTSKAIKASLRRAAMEAV